METAFPIGLQIEQRAGVGRIRKPETAPGTGRRERRYVRVTNADHRGYVEFQFSIGDPGLYLEMTLPPAAFAAFCREHEVVHLNDEQARAVDAAEDKWRYGEPEEE